MANTELVYWLNKKTIYYTIFMCGFIKLAEKGFTVFSLLIFTEAFVILLGPYREPVKQIFLYGFQSITIILLIARWKRVISIVIREKLLWILVGIALLSVLWSEYLPALTLNRSINLLQTTLFGLYFATRYSLKEQLQLLAWTFGMAILLSILVVRLTNQGVMGMSGGPLSSEDIAHAGAWRGIYGHKNLLGRNMVLSGVVFLLSASSIRRHRWIAWAGFGLSVLLMLLSTSKTAVVMLITIIALLPFYRALRWNYTLVVPFFITLTLVSGSALTLLWGNVENLLGLLGRDLTLTGRTDLWAFAIDKISERPWLGYGYNGFWRGLKGPSEEFWAVFRWQVPHSHNGLVDLGLDLGLLGLSVFLLSLLTASMGAVLWVRLTNTAEGLWPLAYLAFMVLSNLTESSLMKPDIFWVLYVAVIFSMHDRNVNLMESNSFRQQKASISSESILAAKAQLIGTTIFLQK